MLIGWVRFIVGFVVVCLRCVCGVMCCVCDCWLFVWYVVVAVLTGKLLGCCWFVFCAVG